MNQKRISFIFLAVGVFLLAFSVFLLTASPVKAQCGSQVSSCKNCHEVQAKKPVNNDGTTWHTQHAFGDFCYLCHGGNNQATDKVAAHTGMVDPISNVVTSCKSCHPSDYTAKAQIYAVTLGKQVGTGGSAATPAATPAASQPASQATPAAAASAPMVAQAVVVPSADIVDYSQRYDAIALGKQSLNIGNIIVMVMIAALLIGGGFFVAKREGWINIAFDDPKRVPVQEKYPADVVDLLPDVNRLKPASRRSLHHLLAKPQAAADLLASIDQYSEVKPPSDDSPEAPSDHPE
jgi:hypothetical protein